MTEALASQRPLPQADLQALEAALSAPTGNLTLVGNTNAAEPHLGYATDAASSAVLSLQIALSVAVFLPTAQRKPSVVVKRKVFYVADDSSAEIQSSGIPVRDILWLDQDTRDSRPT